MRKFEFSVKPFWKYFFSFLASFAGTIFGIFLLQWIAMLLTNYVLR